MTGRRVTRRALLRGVVAGAGASAAAVLTGCGATSTPQVVVQTVVVEASPQVQVVEVTPTVPARTGPVAVTYYSWIDADRLNKFGDWVKPFQEANPGVLVQLIPSIGANIESRQKLQAMILAGTPPDISSYCPPDYMWSGMVQSLQPLIDRDQWDMSDVGAPLVTRASYKGELYNMPLQAGGNNPIMTYNKTLWSEAGVEFPPTVWNDPAWTWDEWVSRVKTVMDFHNDKSGTSDYWGLAHMGWFMSHTRQWNIWWINVEDMKTITADTPEMVDCYTHVMDLWCKHKIIPQAEVTQGWGPVDPFLGGKTNMDVTGSWMYNVYDKAEIDWDFAPFPKPENGNTNSELDPDGGAAIVKGSKNVNEAWEFIKWLDQGNFYTFWASCPSRPKYIDDWGQKTFVNHPDVNYRIFIEAQANAREQDRLTLHPCWGEMYGKVIDPRITQLQACTMPVDQFLAECQVELQKISDTCQTQSF